MTKNPPNLRTIPATGPLDEVAISEGCYYDPKEAARAWKFFVGFLRHSKGAWAGKPFIPQGWQWERLLKPVFGWRKKDGRRRFRRVYVEIPKKNGKSTLAAGIALYLLIGDGEQGAEIYSAAADRDQAAIVYREAKNMVESSDELSETVDTVDSQKRLVFPSTRSFYRVLSAEAPTKEGLDIHGLIFDELHAQKTRELWDTLHYGGAARRQPLFMSFTTAGFDRESICY
jgi:phage terminase large subunit-like protein